MTLTKEHKTKTSKLEEIYQDLLLNIDDNPNREGLKKTALRAAKSIQYLTKGYQEETDSIINDAIFSTQSDELVMVKNIELYSLCEHHILPFFGKCHIAYLPNGKVLGLSKISRIIDIFCKTFTDPRKSYSSNCKYYHGKSESKGGWSRH